MRVVFMKTNEISSIIDFICHCLSKIINYENVIEKREKREEKEKERKRERKEREEEKEKREERRREEKREKIDTFLLSFYSIW
jgi:hypothetical protein